MLSGVFDMLPHITVDCTTKFFGAFPSFSHQIAMTLLSSSISKNMSLIKWSTFWAGINLLFECGQILTSDVSFFPLVINKYLVSGTMDIYDIISIFLAHSFLTALGMSIKKFKGQREK